MIEKDRLYRHAEEDHGMEPGSVATWSYGELAAWHTREHTDPPRGHHELAAARGKRCSH